MTSAHDQEPPAAPEPRSRGQRIGLWLGPLLAALTLLFLDLEPGRPEVTRMAAVALLIATWWITAARLHSLAKSMTRASRARVRPEPGSAHAEAMDRCQGTSRFAQLGDT